MVTVKMLRPYYMKADDNYVRIVLAYQYFTVLINNQIYQFIPVESKEIRINRRTQKVENVDARFAFQKGKDIVYMAVSELISLPDFMVQLHSIAEPYYIKTDQQEEDEQTTVIIDELERLNLKRLIDKSLDERDYEAFQSLTKSL